MLLPIEVWFPAFKDAFLFGIVALIVDSLLQPRRKAKPSPPPAVQNEVGPEKAA